MSIITYFDQSSKNMHQKRDTYFLLIFLVLHYECNRQNAVASQYTR